MVCCCMPCLHKLQQRLDPVPGSGPFTLIFSETVRWICIVVPLYLASWRYYVELDTEDGQTLDGTYWAISTGCILGLSLVVYLPLKIVALKYRMKNNLLQDYRWRPSIVTYIIICALPCLTMILVAIETNMDKEQCQLPDVDCTLDTTTTTVLQVTVFCLTITEWMSKIREDHISYELITAMALDFFFAYDCIQLIMMCTYDEDIYTSEWVYVCFIFAFIAMFRYVPAQPVDVKDKGSSIGAAVCIMVSIFTVDVPFVIIRLSTMIEFGLVVSDIIHPLKNFAMICFGCTQLYIIYNNRYELKKRRKSEVNLALSINRRSKLPDIWNLEKGEETLKEVNGNIVSVGDENEACDDVEVEDGQSNRNQPENPGGNNSLKKRKDNVELTDIED